MYTSLSIARNKNQVPDELSDREPTLGLRERYMPVEAE
jgi:hypothetical protein